MTRIVTLSNNNDTYFINWMTMMTRIDILGDNDTMY